MNVYRVHYIAKNGEAKTKWCTATSPDNALTAVKAADAQFKQLQFIDTVVHGAVSGS